MTCLIQFKYYSYWMIKLDYLNEYHFKSYHQAEIDPRYHDTNEEEGFDLQGMLGPWRRKPSPRGQSTLLCYYYREEERLLFQKGTLVLKGGRMRNDYGLKSRIPCGKR